MARVFVTGSSDGLGKMAAELLIEQGHKIVLHARSTARAEEGKLRLAVREAPDEARQRLQDAGAEVFLIVNRRIVLGLGSETGEGQR